MSIYSVSINVDDELPKYLSTEIECGGKIVANFATDDPVADFNSVWEWAQTHPGHYIETSSVGSFVYDVPGYRFVLDDDGNEWLERVVDTAAADNVVPFRQKRVR